MSDLDYEHISNLFAIVKGNAEHSGKFASIQDYAMRELSAINEQLREKRMSEKAAQDKPRAIPSQQFDASGKPVDDDEDDNTSSTKTTLVDRR